ncbi:ABC transporter permease [Aliifodinibius salipaludis]|uniref:Cell division protein FtsX n=1 Tax=Fodinibius salipaludis TaxID=2032627 RepID=A0A2A2GE16_9BACT|nr:permease-like cell division protein FtsX [Aliifodinibius salipaludis]PAU95608.1 ABC transporter permease [Aliifodinibius salipaludis]
MSLGYVVKEGMAGIGRAKLAAFTSMFSLFIAVLLLGLLARLGYNGYEVAQSLKKSIDVEVFLMDLDERTTNELSDRLKEEKLVQEVSYISKDSAAAVFEKEFGSTGSSLADLKFLPASFKLNIDPDAQISQVDSLVNQIQSYRGVDEVRFNQQLLKRIEANFETAAMMGGGLGILILLASMILVFNTIRLTIYAKRDLIKAMKLVGATNGFIRRPFVVEGIIQGLIAGLLSVGVMFVTFHYLLPEYISELGILEWPFGRWYYLSGAMVLLAVFMGFWGSQWAARKFIKKTSISE